MTSEPVLDKNLVDKFFSHFYLNFLIIDSYFPHIRHILQLFIQIRVINMIFVFSFESKTLKEQLNKCIFIVFFDNI